MSDRYELLDDEPPASPTEERLGRFLEEALNLAQDGCSIDVAALLADQPELIERGRRLVEGLESLRQAAARGAGRIDEGGLPDPFPGEFRIRTPLGQGTFGKVFLADDLHLGRPVALKTLHIPADYNPAGLETLRKEAGFLASLDHRNVVKVHAWRQAGGEHYLVLEYVRGGSLADLLKAEGVLPWQRAARYIANVAEGLLQVHARGIIHRDIKASNILWDPASDEAKLTDFGVAGRLGATRTAVGTPVFMAPEALLGRASEASDVYGLAATLFLQVPQRLEGIIRAGLAAAAADRPALPRFIDLLWGALNQTLVDELLPCCMEGAQTPTVRLRLEVSRKTASGWRPVAATAPPVDVLNRDVRRVPPRPVHARVRTGERLRLEVEADRPGYLAVFNVGPTGNLNLLYPDEEHRDSPTVEAGREVSLEDLVLEPPAGRERMLAVWSSKQLPVSVRELKGLVEGKGEDRSRACRSSRDIVRVRQAVQEAVECQVVVVELEQEPAL
jgi:serine/threonine-protein kinase